MGGEGKWEGTGRGQEWDGTRTGLMNGVLLSVPRGKDLPVVGGGGGGGALTQIEVRLHQRQIDQAERGIEREGSGRRRLIVNNLSRSPGTW